MKKNYFLTGIALVILLLAQLAWAGDQVIRINDPWVREAPPNAPTSAAYMIIENLSARQQTLTSVTSSAFASVMIHQTVNRDGMMQMEHKSQLEIAAKGKVVLAPGGYHLMLMGPKKNIIVGDKVALSLKFAEGEEMVIEVPVRKFSTSDTQ